MSTERNDAALPDEIEKAIERFDAACQSWGWQADQGSDGEAIGASSAEYTASDAALRSAVSAAVIPLKTISDALSNYRSVMADIGSCGDGGCLIMKPEGMHTNGGCRCWTDRMRAQRVMQQARLFASKVSAALASKGEG